VKLLVKRSDLLSNFLADFDLSGIGLGLVSLLKSTSVSIILSNFVSIHTRRRGLDRSRPVEVQVAHYVGQLLDIFSAQLGIIHRHEEVSGQHTTLSSGGGSHEEIEVLIAVIVLNKSVVYYTA